MRLLSYTFIIALSFVGLAGIAMASTQDAVEATSAHATTDEEALKNVALDYAMSWYTGDPDRMERALHPKLAKRRPLPTAAASDEGSLGEMTAEQLVAAVATGNGKRTPESERRADVTVLDVTNGIASVKLDMHGWTDYMHIAKLEGKWVIVNVLWQVHAAE